MKDPRDTKWDFDPTHVPINTYPYAYKFKIEEVPRTKMDGVKGIGFTGMVCST